MVQWLRFSGGPVVKISQGSWVRSLVEEQGSRML